MAIQKYCKDKKILNNGVIYYLNLCNKFMKKITKKQTSTKKTPLTKKATDEQVAKMENSILRHLETSMARERSEASIRDWWVATVLAIRENTMSNFIETMKR